MRCQLHITTSTWPTLELSRLTAPCALLMVAAAILQQRKCVTVKCGVLPLVVSACSDASNSYRTSVLLRPQRQLQSFLRQPTAHRPLV